jgi:hypothetical protein
MREDTDVSGARGDMTGEIAPDLPVYEIIGI